MPVTELVINRPNWLHNEGCDYSRLLRPDDGKMCCLGFYSLACGLTKEDITDVPQPTTMHLPSGVTLPEEMRWLTESVNDASSSPDAILLMAANDNSYQGHTSDRIEELITKVFAKHGVTVTFTDEPMAA